MMVTKVLAEGKRLRLGFSDSRGHHREVVSEGSRSAKPMSQEIRKILRVGPSDKVVFTPLGEGKALITSANRPASDVFGILKHWKLKRPVSINEMELAIKERQVGRGKA
jgi:hypothetical protein